MTRAKLIIKRNRNLIEISLSLFVYIVYLYNKIWRFLEGVPRSKRTPERHSIFSAIKAIISYLSISWIVTNLRISDFILLNFHVCAAHLEKMDGTKKNVFANSKTFPNVYQADRGGCIFGVSNCSCSPNVMIDWQNWQSETTLPFLLQLY